MPSNPNEFQRDAESRFGGTRFNLKPVTQDPVYPRNGDSWFRVDQQLIKICIEGIIYGLALIDGGTGKLLVSQTPDISINDTFVVASEAEMLALIVQTGDLAIRTDSTEVYVLKGMPATDIANWQILTSITAAVTSVNDKVGVVSLSTTDIPEGINLYYTVARFNAALATKSTTDLAEGTNLYYTTGRFNSAFALKTTSDLVEGTQLYYTNARFDARLATKTTDNLTEGATNLYYTTSRANTDFDTRLATKTTSNLAEGSNLYYTNTRFDNRFALKTTSDLAEGSNLYYTTARFDARLALKTTTDLAEGVNLYFTDTRADARITLQKGVAGGLATLDGTGKIPVSQLPGEGTVETFLVASQAAMLALVAQKGDHAKRTDTKDVYILRGSDPTVLTDWEKLVENYDANVETVNGLSGAVTLTTSEITEGTNLYYTAARFNSAFSAKSTSDLTEGTNLYYTDTRFDTRFSSKTTSNLTEGTNLYYTTARANTDFDTRFATKTTTGLTEGTNLYYTSSRANADFDTRLALKTTDNLVEGISNLYYTTARFDTRFGTKTTSDLTEGTNLYYTNARADARIALQKGAVNGIATLDAGGKIPSSQLPAIAITDTYVVISQATMLALTAHTGDVAVRTDLNKTYILRGTDPTVLADWQEMLTPTDTVLSVNGKTGSVLLTTTDITEGTNLYHTDARVRASVLTGLSTATTTPVVSTDTILQAVGKLQGEINTPVYDQVLPADPSTTTSTTGVMKGLGGSITPARSGTVLIIVSGDIDNNTTSDGAQVQVRTGTGTAPANNTALTGTAQGNLVKIMNDSAVPSGTPGRHIFSLNVIVSGLTIGTAIWIDLSLAAITGGTARVRDISISTVEL